MTFASRKAVRDSCRPSPYNGGFFFINFDESHDKKLQQFLSRNRAVDEN